MDLRKLLNLPLNENPYGCAPSVKELLTTVDFQTQMYPDGNATSLRKKLSEKLGVNENALLFGNGSDEIVMVISRALLTAETNTIMATPTFPQYAHSAKIEGAEIREIPLKDGYHDLDGFLQAIDENTAVVWLCNPNNPTGNLIPERIYQHSFNKFRKIFLSYLTKRTSNLLRNRVMLTQ